jgi:hypothetical protein
VKRSGGVTAAGVMLIVAGAMVSLGAFFAALSAVVIQTAGVKTPEPAFARLLTDAVAVLAIAIWGIVTGVGLLRLRRWAWYCVLLISAVLVADAIPGLIHARKLIRATTGVPTVSAGNFVTFEYIGLAIATLVPLALGVWWLIAFLRPSARAQFAPGVILERDYPPVVFAPPVAPPSAAAQSLAEPIPHGSPRLQLSYRRPVSITVIAVFLLAGAAAFPMFLFCPASWRVTALFGVVLTGRAVLVVLATYSALGILLGTGLLLLKPWARMAAIVYGVAITVNVAVSMRAQMRAIQMLQSAMGMPVLPGNGAQMFERMMHVSMAIGVVFGAAVNFVALYFLVTRRAAFYPPRPGPASSLQAAQ